MGIVRKIDRAFQWAGERMGGEAKTTHSEEFKMLETEMNLRHDGLYLSALQLLNMVADVNSLHRYGPSSEIHDGLRQMDRPTQRAHG